MNKQNIYIYISHDDVGELTMLKLNEEPWIESLPFDITEGLKEVNVDKAYNWKMKNVDEKFDQCPNALKMKMQSFFFAIY